MVILRQFLFTPGEGIVAGGSIGGGEIGAGITPGGIAAGGGHGEIGGIVVGGTPSDIDIDSSASVSAGASGSAQVVATPYVNGFTSAVNGMNSQLTQLNAEAAGASGLLAEDIRKINEQYKALTGTLSEALFETGERNVLSDTSTEDAEQVTLGKAAESLNAAAVEGDLNVGGIAGCMAVEYEADPEDDVSADLSAQERREYEMKAVILRCTNTGEITSKRNYVGGVTGRMDLGMIQGADSFGTVQSESGSYVGGISGLTGGTIRNCFVNNILQSSRKKKRMPPKKGKHRPRLLNS